MKKSIYSLIIVSIFTLFSIVSCSEKPDPDVIDITNPTTPPGTTKHCWEFTTKVKTSIKGVSIPGYPQTVTATTKECDLTESQAEEIVKKATTTASSTVQGVTATIVTTCTKRKL